MDETCSARIKWDAYGVFDDLRAQDGQTHLPVHPKQDDNYRTFRKYAGKKFKWPDGGRCQDCPLYRILVTAEGRFEYFAAQTVAVMANPAARASGYSAGDLDLPLLRFVPQSVSDVSATPIDPFVYSEKKRRDVTLEEAHELVTVVLRGHGPYALDPYEVESFPDFQFYQALWHHPHGNFNIHHAVDRKTGEVWGDDACEPLTSPSLKKLQNAIRARIGLTSDEVRQLRPRGPLCDE